MSTPFEPRNTLEQQLLAAQEGQLEADDFVRVLLDSQVFIPIKDDIGIGGFQASTRGLPLSIKTEDGIDILILFTSPDRARPFVLDHPGYEDGGILEDFRWVLDKMGTGYGIVLNPGCEVGFDLAPEMVQKISTN